MANIRAFQACDESSILSARTTVTYHSVADIAQLVRAPDCGPGGRRFNSAYSPQDYYKNTAIYGSVFILCPLRLLGGNIVGLLLFAKLRFKVLFGNFNCLAR